MKTPKLAIAMNYIDDNLISEAIDYTPTPSKMKTACFHHAIVAACLCLVVLGIARITVGFLSDQNTNTPVYGVLAEVIGIQDNGLYKVRITGEDQNFAKDDIIILHFDFVSNDSEIKSLKTGDIIAITYSTYKSVGNIYEISHGQIEIVQSSSE